MNEKFFNPDQPKYQSVEDLPKKEQKNYSNVEGGFIPRSVEENDTEAEIAAMIAGAFAEDVLHVEAESFDKERNNTLRTIKGVVESEEFRNQENQDARGFKILSDKIKEAEVAIELSPFKKELCDSEGIIKEYARIDVEKAISFMSDRLKNDKRFILELLNLQGESAKDIGKYIAKLPENMTKDMDIIMAAMKTSPEVAFRYLPQDKRDDLKFIKMVFSIVAKKYDSPTIRRSISREILNYVSEPLRGSIYEKIRTAQVLEMQARRASEAKERE